MNTLQYQGSLEFPIFFLDSFPFLHERVVKAFNNEGIWKPYRSDWDRHAGTLAEVISLAKTSAVVAEIVQYKIWLELSGHNSDEILYTYVFPMIQSQFNLHETFVVSEPEDVEDVIRRFVDMKFEG